LKEIAMFRSAFLLAFLGLSACTGTPSTPSTPSGGSPSPTAPVSGSSTSPTATATPKAAKGGALHLDFTDTGTAKPDPGQSYDAESLMGTAPANGLPAAVFAHATQPDRNFNITFGTTAPKAGDTITLQNKNIVGPGYFQYAQSDGAAVQPKTYLWYATSGTVKIDSVEGTTVSFTYSNAVMVPKNDTGGPTSAGTFTINGTGHVDNFPQ
jgi:hypothetical protein